MTSLYQKFGGLGERMRSIRQHLGESQTTFAVRFNLKRYDIANYERSRSDLPSRVMGYLDELGFNISWLVTGVGKMHKVDELLMRFKSLSEEFDRLSTEYHQAREELLRVLAVAETGRFPFNEGKRNVDQNDRVNAEDQKVATGPVDSTNAE